MINKCDTCKHENVLLFEKPCRDCVTVDFVDGIKPDVKCSNWEPKEPCPKPAEVFIRWNQESIERQRCNLLKNSVPGSDIKPGRPSPYLVGAKKSKWRKWDEKKPKDTNRTYMVWNDDPVPGHKKLYCHIEFNGVNFVSECGYVFEHVTHYRYMPKPPKEYRK